MPAKKKPSATVTPTWESTVVLSLRNKVDSVGPIRPTVVTMILKKGDEIRLYEFKSKNIYLNPCSFAVADELYTAKNCVVAKYTSPPNTNDILIRIVNPNENWNDIIAFADVATGKAQQL